MREACVERSTVRVCKMHFIVNRLRAGHAPAHARPQPPTIAVYDAQPHIQSAWTRTSPQRPTHELPCKRHPATSAPSDLSPLSCLPPTRILPLSRNVRTVALADSWPELAYE